MTQPCACTGSRATDLQQLNTEGPILSHHEDTKGHENSLVKTFVFFETSWFSLQFLTDAY
jgi:hypothetical protein